MKILLVSNMYPDKKHPSYGIFVKRFADELNKIGVLQCKSVMHQHDGKLRKALGYFVFYAGTFFKILFGKYDCVYIHQASHSSPPVIVAAKIKKFKIYTNVHGCDVVPENTNQEKMQKYTRKILMLSDKIIVPSKYYEKLVSKKYSLERERIFIYPSAGIDRSIFFEKTAEDKKFLKEKYDFKDGVPIFGMAGRISEGKGWDTFVKAISILKKDNIEAAYIIVGAGREDNKLDALIKEYCLTDDIIRIGLLPQDELCDYYNIIDYFVFPTKREGESLGLVALEAMACGTPVISSDFAAPRYYVKNGINGYKFNVDDSQQLSEIMKQCCNLAKEKYQKLSEGAVRTAEDYNSNNIRKKLEIIISSIQKPTSAVETIH